MWYVFPLCGGVVREYLPKGAGSTQSISPAGYSAVTKRGFAFLFFQKNRRAEKVFVSYCHFQLCACGGKHKLGSRKPRRKHAVRLLDNAGKTR